MWKAYISLGAFEINENGADRPKSSPPPSKFLDPPDRHSAGLLEGSRARFPIVIRVPSLPVLADNVQKREFVARLPGHE